MNPNDFKHTTKAPGIRKAAKDIKLVPADKVKRRTAGTAQPPKTEAEPKTQ